MHRRASRCDIGIFVGLDEFVFVLKRPQGRRGRRSGNCLRRIASHRNNWFEMFEGKRRRRLPRLELYPDSCPLAEQEYDPTAVAVFSSNDSLCLVGDLGDRAVGSMGCTNTTISTRCRGGLFTCQWGGCAPCWGPRGVLKL